MAHSSPFDYTSDQDWDQIETANPADPILMLIVKTSDITLDNPGIVGNKPKRERPAVSGQAYAPPTQFWQLDPKFLFPSVSVLGCDEWYFIGAKNLGGGRTAFYFFRNKSATELNIPDEEVQVTGAHYWPPVLKDVFADIDYSANQSSNIIKASSLVTEGGTSSGGEYQQGIVTAPIVRIQKALISAIKEGSTIITQTFQSALQPMRRYDKVPQPQPVSVYVNGERYDIDEVLHDDLRFDPTPSGSLAFFTDGSTIDVGGAVGEQFFERTNFIDWRQYVISRQPSRNEYGLWTTTVIKVRPPKRQVTLRP